MTPKSERIKQALFKKAGPLEDYGFGAGKATNLPVSTVKAPNSAPSVAKAPYPNQVYKSYGPKVKMPGTQLPNYQTTAYEPIGKNNNQLVGDIGYNNPIGLTWDRRPLPGISTIPFTGGITKWTTGPGLKQPKLPNMPASGILH